METTAPIIPPPRSLWIAPGVEPRAADAERRQARRLGFELAVAIAAAFDVLVAAYLLLAVGGGDSVEEDLVGIGIAAFALVLPIASAAPLGWLLGPTVARAHLAEKIAAAVLMALFAMLIGDALIVGLWVMVEPFADAAGTSGTALELLALGAAIVGPFVVIFATLPASVVWVCLFRLCWRSRAATHRG